MQDRPDKDVLLAAIAKFLDEDVRPAIADPGLAFRVRIAANLARIVAIETNVEDGHDAREIEGLIAILPDQSSDLPIAGATERRESIRMLNLALTERIRDADFDDEQLEQVRLHVERTLVDKLSVVNPRFDTRQEIE